MHSDGTGDRRKIAQIFVQKSSSCCWQRGRGNSGLDGGGGGGGEQKAQAGGRRWPQRESQERKA